MIDAQVRLQLILLFLRFRAPKIIYSDPVLQRLRLKVTARLKRVILVCQRRCLRVISCDHLFVTRVWWHVAVWEICWLSGSRLSFLFALEQLHVSKILQIVIQDSFFSLQLSLISEYLILYLVFTWLPSSVVRLGDRRTLAIILVVLVVSSACIATNSSIVRRACSHVAGGTSKTTVMLGTIAILVFSDLTKCVLVDRLLTLAKWLVRLPETHFSFWVTE